MKYSDKLYVKRWDIMVRMINSFFRCFFRKKHVFNLKPTRSTRKSLRQAEYIIRHPEKYKGYHNLDEMFNDILSEN